MDGSECVNLQRATGQLNFHVNQKRVSRMYQSGSAKLMLPNTYSDMMEAVILNTSGGMTDGDIFNIDVQADDCALTMTTQAAERIYRSGGSRPSKVEIIYQSPIKQIFIGCRKKQSYIITPNLTGR